MFRPSIPCAAVAALFALAWLAPATAGAAGSERSLPFTLTSSALPPLARVSAVEMAPVNVAALLAEDERPRTDPVPRRVGQPLEVDIAPDRAGTWDMLPGGDGVWRVRVRAPGALWIVLGFGTFRLQPGAELRIFDPAGTTVLGPYTSDDVRDHGQLWTPPLAGDTAVVELLWPRALANEAPRIHLGTVSHGYRAIRGLVPREIAIEAADATAAGTCEIDVRCPLGDNWTNERRGVVNILRNGGAWCSGSLVATTAGDCRPLVLTANHCFSTAGSAAAATLMFNYERPQCGSGIAPTNQVISGATLRANIAASDFSLLEASSAIPATFRPYFNGWSRSTTPAGEAWGIHHPAGSEKKISHAPSPLATGTFYSALHWHVTWWNDGHEGVTEGGSSGSPLFDPQHRIVGQLHGGFSGCTATPDSMWDEYGALWSSWTGGGTAATRLSDWLDPLGINAPFLDGTDFDACHGPAPRLAYATVAVDDAAGNANGAIDPGERITLAVTLVNTGTAGATNILGTLSSTSPSVTFAGAGAAWPAIPAQDAASSIAPHFAIDTSPAIACGTPIPLQLRTTATEAPGTWNLSFDLHVGTATTLFADDMERGAGAWVAGAGWSLSTSASASPSHAWHVADAATATDTSLVMAPIANLGRGVSLRFAHTFGTENSFDGGVLEYTTNGGTTWLDAGPLITSGGYLATIDASAVSPLAGRDAWAGDSGGWRNVVVDLSSLAGQTVRFRWRFATNEQISVGTGWFIDDVRLDGWTCSPVGEASGAGGGAAFRIARSGASYALSWSAPGAGPAPQRYSLYRTSLAAGAPARPTCEADLGTGTSATLGALTSGSGFLVVAHTSLGEGSYGVDSDGHERPRAVGADACP